MKTSVAVFVIAGALAACKSKPAPTTVAESPREPAPASECGKTAAHSMALMQVQMGDALSEADWPKVTAVLEERCTKDGWSAAAMTCMQAATDEATFGECADQLTEPQTEAVKSQFEREIDPLMRKGEAEGAMQSDGIGAPPPDDPCGGGE